MTNKKSWESPNLTELDTVVNATADCDPSGPVTKTGSASDAFTETDSTCNGGIDQNDGEPII